MSKKNMIVIPFGKKETPKSVGACDNTGGFSVVFGIFKRLKTEGYEYGMSVKKEDVGEPIIGFAFDEVEDWKNFVYIVNHQDKLIDERLNGKGTQNVEAANK